MTSLVATREKTAARQKTPWHDGTTHVVCEPLDFVAKLAALVPKPNKNLVLYHGVLSAHSLLTLHPRSHRRHRSAEESVLSSSQTTALLLNTAAR
jgi:cytochrome P450